jgi:hypothetical protein
MLKVCGASWPRGVEGFGMSGPVDNGVGAREGDELSGIAPFLDVSKEARRII